MLAELSRLLPIHIGGGVIVGALAPSPVGTLFGVLGLTLALFGVARIRAEDRRG